MAKQLIGILVFMALACGLILSCSGLKQDPAARNKGNRVHENNEKPAIEKISLAEAEQALDQKEKTIEALEAKIQRLNRKIKELEERNARKKTESCTVNDSRPVQLYKKARNVLLEEDYIRAAKLFSLFAKTHPEHSLADNALYWLGECYYSLGQYPAAIKEFKRLVATYPKAEKVPDGLLKLGYSYLSLDDVNRANHFLRQVLRKYPFSPAAEKAQTKLKSFE